MVGPKKKVFWLRINVPPKKKIEKIPTRNVNLSKIGRTFRK